MNEEQYLELLLGPGDASAFQSDESRRAAWQKHRNAVMTLVEAGSRPWAWWQYEAPEPPGPREPTLDFLRRFDLLTPAEKARLGPGPHAWR